MTVPELYTEDLDIILVDGVNDYPFTFKVLEETDVIVVNSTTNAAGDPGEQTYDYGTHYTVTLNTSGVDGVDGDTGGVVSFTGAEVRIDGDAGRIYRLEDYLQLVSLGRESNLNLKIIERMFDKATIQIQQLRNNFSFLETVTIPGLAALITAIINGVFSILGPGGAHNPRGIPQWVDTATDTLDAGLVGTVTGQIIQWNNVTADWEIATGVPTLDMGAVIVPGVTTIGGIAYWNDLTGTTLGTIPAGADNTVFAGNGVGVAPSFKALLTLLGSITSTAGQIIQLNGTGVAATAVDLPAIPTGTPSVLTPTSDPAGFKMWSLAKPGNYAVGGIPATITNGGGSTAYSSNVNGSYIDLTSRALVNNTVQAYTTKADSAATRSAQPTWITRLLTGPVITNSRIWVAFNKDIRTTLIASAAPTDSTAGFRYDTAAGDTNWMCVTVNGAGASTVQSSGIPVAVNTDYVLCIDFTLYGSVRFYINNVLVKTIATTLPEVEDALDWLICLRTLNAAAKTLGFSVVNMTHR